MSTTVLILGESGSGKSTSLRNLNPEETFIINVIGKPLPFKGANKNYFFNAQNPKMNYVECDNAKQIIDYIQRVNKNRPEIKNIIIDDAQYIMANEFMRRCFEKGYDKFTEIAHNFWSIINALSNGRPDIDCFVLSHTDTDQNGKTKCKTIGKMLDEKISIDGMFTIALHAMVIDGKYKFLTQNDGTHTSKSPMGMFDQLLIDNDIQYVKEKINQYFNEEL